MTLYLGIDPGANGGAAILDDENVVALMAFAKMTKPEIAATLDLRSTMTQKVFAMLEHIPAAIPPIGRQAALMLGKSAGFLEGCICSRIPYELVLPRVWQAALKCLSGGDKNVTKEAAQRLFPCVAIGHATADALLIAEYCRRTIKQREGMR